MIPLFFTPYRNPVGPRGRRRIYQVIPPAPDLRRPDDDDLIAAVL